MSTRATMLDSARSALQDRAEQAATIRDSLSMIERSASAIPDQIEVAAERLTALARSLAKLISESEAALGQHQAMTDAASIAAQQMQAATIEIGATKATLSSQAATIERMRGQVLTMHNTIVDKQNQVTEATGEIKTAIGKIEAAAETAGRRQWTTRQAVAAVLVVAIVSSTLPHWPAWIAALIGHGTL